ncbi:hypothetical protein NDU88_010580 [Pleurodeles waltl]|uniref:Uncharacterized protein n=1 Tax=Pleurodeles waltl TaxID=8319 RepID=A0AAV7S177_PLEWA|nr:hypothetical protein NDU88_010580 [Pleurodeles waltl]
MCTSWEFNARRLQPAFSVSVLLKEIFTSPFFEEPAIWFSRFSLVFGLFDTKRLLRVLDLSARVLLSLFTCSVTRRCLGTWLLRNEDAYTRKDMLGSLLVRMSSLVGILEPCLETRHKTGERLGWRMWLSDIKHAAEPERRLLDYVLYYSFDTSDQVLLRGDLLKSIRRCVSGVLAQAWKRCLLSTVASRLILWSPALDYELWHRVASLQLQWSPAPQSSNWPHKIRQPARGCVTAVGVVPSDSTGAAVLVRVSSPVRMAVLVLTTLVSRSVLR